MACGRNKKVKNYAIKTRLPYIAKKSKSNKENISECKKPDAQYLYLNRIFLNKRLENCYIMRLENGDQQEEVYYDCQSTLGKENTEDEPLKVQQLLMRDVLNGIENAKKFKKAFKQLIINLQFLYCTFRKAYCSSKKKSQKALGKNTALGHGYCQCCGDKKMDNLLCNELPLKSKNRNKFENFYKTQPCNANLCKDPNNTHAIHNNEHKCFKNLNTEIQTRVCSLQSTSPCLMKANESQQISYGLTNTNAFGKYASYISPGCCQPCQPKKYIYRPTAIINKCMDPDMQTQNLPFLSLSIPVQLQINADENNLLLPDANTANQSPDCKETQTFSLHDSQDYFSCNTNSDIISIAKTSTTRLSNILEMDEQIPVLEEALQEQPKWDDLKAKSGRLRVKLVDEINLALEQNTPTEAIQALHKETTENKYARLSLPTSDEARPFNGSPIESVKSLSLQSLFNKESYVPLVTHEKDSEMDESNVHLDPSLGKENSDIGSLEPSETYVDETSQTTVSSIQPFGHYKRNEMRREIQQQLKELLASSDSIKNSLYSTKERKEILLELHRLFHPVKSDLLPNDLKLQNVVHDIRYILDFSLSTDAKLFRLPKSEEIMIDSVKHVINPKAELKNKNEIPKYESSIKHRILEQFIAVLKPTKQRISDETLTRNAALLEIRLLLNTGEIRKSSLRSISQDASLVPEEITDYGLKQDVIGTEEGRKEEKEDFNKNKSPNDKRKKSSGRVSIVEKKGDQL